jgi:hypothetical protein
MFQQPSCYLCVVFIMDPNQTPQTFGEMMQYLLYSNNRFTLE